MDLRGRSALITGGTQGVGSAIALSLAQAGANIILHGLEPNDAAIETISQCLAHSVRVTPLYCDLLQPIDQVIQQLGEGALAIDSKVDLLVNNAGIFIDRPATAALEAS